MFRIIKRLLRDEEGPTAVEYAVMLALIVAGIIGVIGSVGAETGGLWGNNHQQLEDAGLGNGS